MHSRSIERSRLRNACQTAMTSFFKDIDDGPPAKDNTDNEGESYGSSGDDDAVERERGGMDLRPTLLAAGNNKSLWTTRRACYYLTNHWKTLLLGQMLSFLLASAGAAQATLHLDCGLSSPTFTMSLIYLVLCATHLLPLLWRRQRRGQVIFQEPTQEEPQYTFLGLPLQGPVWQYMIIAFLDVEANAITMLSFRYTTLTSVTLFDALAIPSAMIISWCFLGRRYTWIHYLGVVTCMAGVIFNVMQDYESDTSTGNEASSSSPNDGSEEYPHKLRGDILAIIGGIMYGLNDVLTEATVRRNGGTTEYLAVMGLFAFGISLVQALTLEWQDILEFFGEGDAHSSTCSLAMGWWLLFVFVGVTLMSYKGASVFLMMSEAAFFNLSLLTGDLWSITFSVVAEGIVPQSLFFVALIFVLSGVVLYEMAPSPVLEDNNNNHQAVHERMPQHEHDDLALPHVTDENKASSLELT